MNDPSLDSVLEFALHAMVSARCRRAYSHDLRNGLQGIYGGFDVLTRMAKGTAGGSPPADKVADMVKRAMASHEKALDGILNHLLRTDGSERSVAVDESLQELARFLNNDATARDVSIRVTAACGQQALVPQPTWRLVLLSLLVDSIDAMALGGELHVESRTLGKQIVVELTLLPRGELARKYDDVWRLDLSAVPQWNGLVFYVVRQLVHGAGGVIDHRSCGEGGHKITLQYPSVASA